MSTVPESTKSGNENRGKVVANPSAGTRAIPGKTNDACSVMTDAYKATPEAVRQATSDAGACLRAVDKQTGENGNPKKRTRNRWGIPDGSKE
jgi:hypothetical protein